VRSLLLAAKPSRYAPLFELVNTGLRRGEALALHWSDIDLDAKLLRIRGTLARGRRAHSDRHEDAEVSPGGTPVPHCGAAAARGTRQSGRAAESGSMWQPTPHVFTTELGGPAIRAMRCVR
jgi:integrase